MFGIIIYFHRRYEKNKISEQIKNLRYTIGYKLSLKDELDRLVSHWEQIGMKDNIMFNNIREAQSIVNKELSFEYKNRFEKEN